MDCSICHDAIVEAGEINSCAHRFCYPCISMWSTIENSCPMCKLRFATITKKRLPGTPCARLQGIGPADTLPGTVLKVDAVIECNQRPAFADPNFQEWINGLACLVCGGEHDEEQLLLCDGCDSACHTYCANLVDIPDGEWFCSHCTRQRRQRQQQPRHRREVVELLDDDDEEERADFPPLQRRQQRRDRRRRVTVVIDDTDSDDEIEEEEEGQRRRQRRRLETGASVGGGSRDAGDLGGFIVSDDDDEEDDFESSPEVVQRRQQHQQRRGTRGARQEQRRGRRGQPVEVELEPGGWRQRRRVGTRAAPSPEALGSDFEEAAVEWADWSSGGEKGGSGSDEEEAVLVPRAGRNSSRHRQAQQQQQQQPQRRSRAGQAAAAAFGREGRSPSAAGAAAGAAAPTAAHRAVHALARNWDAIRSGEASFGDVLGSTTPKEAAGPSRRQRQHAQRETVDLTGSGSGPEARSPPMASLGAKLRKDLAQCRERGARLPPRRQALAATATTAPTVTPRGAAGGPSRRPPSSPGSSGRRLRTVADLNFGTRVAFEAAGGRGGNGSGSGPSDRPLHQFSRFQFAGPLLGVAQPPEPINPDGRTSPAPLRERLAARGTATEWRPFREPRQQQQPPQQQQHPVSGFYRPAALPPQSGAARPNPSTIREDIRSIYSHHEQQQQMFAPRVADASEVGPTPPDLAPPHRNLQVMPAPGERLPATFSLKGDTEAPFSDGATAAALRNSATTASPDYRLTPSASQRQRARGAAEVRPAVPSLNEKEIAASLVKQQLRVLYDEEAISKLQFKELARSATHALMRTKGARSTPEDAAKAVDESLVAMVRAQR